LGEAGQSYATLISSITSTEQEILATRMALEGSVTTSDIIQAPTLEEQPLPQKKLLSAVLAAFATGVVLLLFAFVRAGFANAAQEARGAGKVERIKRACRLKRVSGRPGRLCGSARSSRSRLLSAHCYIRPASARCRLILLNA